MMPAVVVFDVIATLGFGVAFVSIMFLIGRSTFLEPRAHMVLALALLIYLFVAFFNVLEHADITSSLDALEDHLEVAFFPLLAYVAYSIDASARIREAVASEAALRRERDLTRSVIDTSPAAVVMLDATGELLFASDVLRSRFGVEYERALEAGDLKLRPHGRLGAAGPELTISDVAAHAPFTDQLFVVDGHGVRVMSASAERTSDAEDADTVLALVDVTERMESQTELAAYRDDLESQVDVRTRELMQLNAELARANSAKQDFLSKMSHELRTPLNSIIGFTSVMLRGMAGEVSEEQRTQLQMVEHAGQRLLSLVNDVLDVSKIDAGEATVSLKLTELHMSLASLVGEMRPFAQERGITLEFENESTRPEIRTDASKVEQIVRNLVSNGLKFTPEGGTVSVRIVDTPAALEIIVCDTGIGMSTREKTRVFDPFYQGPATPEAALRPPGTGLGLSIARELTELIGATLDVSSTLGQGSEFTVRIPV